MSHFAKLDSNKKVIEIIVAEQDFINSGAVGDSFLWVQTSYGGNFRKNYAGTGFTYDSIRDAFIAPQPFESWTLNEDTCKWESPVPYPTVVVDEHGNPIETYRWDEETSTWIIVE
jgi:hypothetical protein